MSKINHKHHFTSAKYQVSHQCVLKIGGKSIPLYLILQCIGVFKRKKVMYIQSTHYLIEATLKKSVKNSTPFQKNMVESKSKSALLYKLKLTETQRLQSWRLLVFWNILLTFSNGCRDVFLKGTSAQIFSKVKYICSYLRC